MRRETGNAFGDPGFAADEARNLALRSELMLRIRERVKAGGLTQAELAVRLGVTQPRLNALLRGKIDQFSLDALVNVATRAGLHVALRLGRTQAPNAALPDQSSRRGGPGGCSATRSTAVIAADLAAIPLFASLTPVELQEAVRLFTVRSYPKDAVVATEGDRLDMFNVILSGRIQWLWFDEAGHQWKRSVEGPGGHFSDVTLGGEPILMSVIALEDLRVAAIPMTEFRQLLPRHPQVAVVLLMDVVTRLRRLLEAARSLRMEDVYARVVKLLLARAVEADGKLVIERLTHAEIGHQVGATREMVGRILRDLARGDYIKVKADRGQMTILRTLPKRW